MYEEFAQVYDELMEEIPYMEWFSRIHEYLCRKGMENGVICELGCGTGTMTSLFARAGYRMIGVDFSEDMLALARQKAEEEKDSQEESREEESGEIPDILYLHQDMTELTLTEPVDAVISVCDSMNYLLDETALDKVFHNVRKYLKSGGYFIFDMKTAYCYQQVIGNRTYVEETEDTLCIWDNEYEEETGINEYIVTLFKKCPDSEKYERFDEVHEQRAYSGEEIRSRLLKAGFFIENSFDETMEQPPKDTSERVFYVVRKMTFI